MVDAYLLVQPIFFRHSARSSARADPKMLNENATTKKPKKIIRGIDAFLCVQY